MSFCTQEKASDIANTVLAAQEVTPLSHERKCELIADELTEQGFTPKKSLVLMIVKLVNLGWQNTVQSTQRQVRKEYYTGYRKTMPSWRYQERGE